MTLLGVHSYGPHNVDRSLSSNVTEMSMYIRHPPDHFDVVCSVVSLAMLHVLYTAIITLLYPYAILIVPVPICIQSLLDKLILDSMYVLMCCVFAMFSTWYHFLTVMNY